MTNINDLSTDYCTITVNAIEKVKNTQAIYFKEIQGLDTAKFAADTLNPRKSKEAGELLSELTSLKNKKVLEIGTGCGVTHISWTNLYNIDGYGIEPEGFGFDESGAIGRQLILDNGLDPTRIVNGTGENMPFSDNTFDIVYSSNVLEHTQDPSKVLLESVRVLKRGGLAHIITPNYWSYFDGHYAAFHPPIFSNRFFCWWVKVICKKNPEFAKTIRTELNPHWVTKQLKLISRNTPIELISLGQATFKKRMLNAHTGNWMALGKLQRLIVLTKHLKLSWLAAIVIIALKGWTPLIISIKKT